MIKVLFLCTGNSCRSQMAEAFTRAVHKDTISAFSAGISPKAVDPRAAVVMKEAGVSIDGQRAKHLDEFKGYDFDFVITLCDNARESCPLYWGRAKKLHIGFDDPPFLARAAKTEEEALSHYRRVRDEIRRFVETLPNILKENDSE